MPMQRMVRQRGVSLVSLMIGLVISLIAVMGMMALYRTVVHTTAESGSYARMTGERSSAVLTAHIYLQEAGFGVDNAALGTDLAFCAASMEQERLTVTNCSTSRSGRLLLWRMQTIGEQCAGLYLTANGGVEYLQPASCTGAGLAASWDSGQRVTLYTTTMEGAVFSSIEIIEEDCQALGVAGAGAYRVNLRAHHPLTEDYDAADASTFLPINSSTCLINFR